MPVPKPGFPHQIVDLPLTPGGRYRPLLAIIASFHPLQRARKGAQARVLPSFSGLEQGMRINDGKYE